MCLQGLDTISTDFSDFLAAAGGEEGELSGDTPHPGKGLRPLHLFCPSLWDWIPCDAKEQKR